MLKFEMIAGRKVSFPIVRLDNGFVTKDTFVGVVKTCYHYDETAEVLFYNGNEWERRLFKWADLEIIIE